MCLICKGGGGEGGKERGVAGEGGGGNSDTVKRPDFREFGKVVFFYASGPQLESFFVNV